MSSKTLQETALEPSPDERAELAPELLLSLDDPSEGALAEAWLSEAKHRASEIDRGEVQAIDAEEVRRKVRTLLR